MDRGLAAVLGAAALLGLVGVYFHNRADGMADAQVNQIDVLQATVTKLYAAKGDYENAYTFTLAQTGLLPPEWTMLDQNVITSMYRSNISISFTDDPVTGRSNGAFNIILQSVPLSACSVLGTSPYAGRLVKLYIVGNLVAGYGSGKTVGDAAEVTKACQDVAGGTGTVPFIEYTYN